MKYRIVFFGTSEFAIPALRALVVNDMTPLVVVTAPDKPAGRRLTPTLSPVKKDIFAEVTVLQPDKLNKEFIDRISALNPDVGVVVSYGKIISQTIIDIFPQGILNIHPSLLPKYRGPSPIENTILAGDAETGVTIIQIDDKMDHGPVIAQQKVSLQKANTSYQELHNHLAELGAELLIETLPKWIDGKIKTTSQDDTRATYTHLIKKEDGHIDWSRDASYIERMVRAYNPWPGAYTYNNAGVLLKIKKVEVIPTHGNFSSGIIFKTSDWFPAVMCGKEALKLLVIQPEGKRDMFGGDFLKGHQEIIGTVLQ